VISKELEEHLRKEIRKYMNDLADVIATGGVRTWDEYKYVTGQIAGIAYVERIFLDAIELRDRGDTADD
jgi:hypothetical protein